jgi:hypothetical protein
VSDQTTLKINHYQPKKEEKWNKRVLVPGSVTGAPGLKASLAHSCDVQHAKIHSIVIKIVKNGIIKVYIKKFVKLFLLVHYLKKIYFMVQCYSLTRIVVIHRVVIWKVKG